MGAKYGNRDMWEICVLEGIICWWAMKRIISKKEQRI
jgi:hypothetical protein